MLNLLQEKFLLWIVAIASIIAITTLEWMIYLVNIPMRPLFATILASIFLIFCFVKLIRIKTLIRNYRLGRDGAREVAQTLDNLIRSTGCYIYHSVIFKRNGKIFDIDHIMVSKLGIFIIETKTRSKKVKSDTIEYFDGKSVKLANHPLDSKPVDQVRRNINILREELVNRGVNGKALDIIGIIVYPGWFFDKGKMDTRLNIWVSNPKYLEWAITVRNPILTEEEVIGLTHTMDSITINNHPLTVA